jgi:hypothetical protein
MQIQEGFLEEVMPHPDLSEGQTQEDRKAKFKENWSSVQSNVLLRAPASQALLPSLQKHLRDPSWVRVFHQMWPKLTAARTGVPN